VLSRAKIIRDQRKNTLVSPKVYMKVLRIGHTLNDQIYITWNAHKRLEAWETGNYLGIVPQGSISN
jgi:hypothetical protein